MKMKHYENLRSRESGALSPAHHAPQTPSYEHNTYSTTCATFIFLYERTTEPTAVDVQVDKNTLLIFHSSEASF